MSDDVHVLDLLPAYVVSSLDAEAARGVEEHLSSCLICRNESDSLRTAADQLSFAAPTATPAPDLKDRLMRRIQAGSRGREVPAPRPWLERLLPAWGLASLALIIALAGLNLVLWRQLEHPALLSGDGMRAAPLRAPDAASKATGFVLVSEDGDSGALVVDGLPPLAQDRQYQVWLIRDGHRTSGAVFSTDEKSYATTRIWAPDSLLEYSAVDITVEPSGGSSQPTGAQVLAGPLFGP
jgi:anti-sigma-K factor RskA